MSICLSSLGYIPGSGIAGSYGNSVFHFLRNCHAGFHSGHAHVASSFLHMIFLYSASTVHADEEGFAISGHCSVCYSVLFGMVYLLES